MSSYVRWQMPTKCTVDVPLGNKIFGVSRSKFQVVLAVVSCEIRKQEYTDKLVKFVHYVPSDNGPVVQVELTPEEVDSFLDDHDLVPE